MPRSILYDNTRLAVARILGGGERQRTRAFAELRSHYLFLDRFGRPGKGNDKGKVEGLVGFARRNFLVPIPSGQLCRAQRPSRAALPRPAVDRLRGHAESIGERLERDLAALQPRPPVPYDACDRRPARVSSLSLVRYERNDYSVPTAYGHRPVLVQGYVEEVVIACGAEIIARHERSYAREDFVFDPLHYLALLEQKTGAGPGCPPGLVLPEEFATLRRLLEARMGKPGKRSTSRCAPARDLQARGRARRGAPGTRLGAIGFDAVKHLVLCRIERRPPKLDLTAYPYLPRSRSRPPRPRPTWPARRGGGVSDPPQPLLAHHLKALKLPTFLREHDKLARQCAAEGADHTAYLLRLAELELWNASGGWSSGASARGPLPGGQEPGQLRLRRHPGLEQDAGPGARPLCYLEQRENVIALGPSGTGKTPSPSGSGWPPASRASPSASPPPRPWSTSCWRPGTSGAFCACRSS